jgi:hypothetical protein
MDSSVEKAKSVEASTATAERPRYEAPRIQVMSERDILNTFQLTQSMAGWWATAMC